MNDENYSTANYRLASMAPMSNPSSEMSRNPPVYVLPSAMSQNPFHPERHQIINVSQDRSPDSSSASVSNFEPSFAVDVKRESLNENDNELEEETEIDNHERDTGRHDGIFAWPKSATLKLLDLYKSDTYYEKFQGRLVKKKQLWNEITSILVQGGYTKGEQITWEHCSNKFRNLKKTYIECLHRSNNIQGDTSRRFEYFDQMHEIFGSLEVFNSQERSGPLETSNTDMLSLDSQQSMRDYKNERSQPVFESINASSAMNSMVSNYGPVHGTFMNTNSDTKDLNTNIINIHNRKIVEKSYTLERQNDVNHNGPLYEGTNGHVVSSITSTGDRNRIPQGTAPNMSFQYNKDYQISSVTTELSDSRTNERTSAKNLVPSRRRKISSVTGAEGKEDEPVPKKKGKLIKKEFVLEAIRNYFDERKQENQQMICLFKEMLHSYKEMQTRQIAIFETFLTTIANLSKDETSEEDED